MSERLAFSSSSTLLFSSILGKRSAIRCPFLHVWQPSPLISNENKRPFFQKK
uniref:Uncharacterized protein n=1 Tax=Arundo donax TaxID=35708 RepID=A0A0A9APV4_ARUDO